LEVGVRSFGLSQPFRQSGPHLHEGIQNLRTPGLVPDHLMQEQAVDPLHFQHREPIPADPDTFGQEREPDGERETGLLERLRHFGIPIRQSDHGPGETLDRPVATVLAVDLIDIGKVTRPLERSPLCPDYRLAVLQVRIRKGCGGALDGVVELLGGWPVHSDDSGTWSVSII
jgi:hypothetical protein